METMNNSTNELHKILEISGTIRK